MYLIEEIWRYTLRALDWEDILSPSKTNKCFCKSIKKVTNSYPGRRYLFQRYLSSYFQEQVVEKEFFQDFLTL